jgi:carbon-monoxide dehydrogenase small subunit
MAAEIVELEVSGRHVEVMVRPLQTLQSVLREQLGLTSVKEGCRQGGCGSCTVLVDGEPMPSCLLPAQDVVGRKVTTVEGITPPDGLAPVQEAFLDTNGFQCGYCTPGMVMLTTALLRHDPHPSRQAIVDGLSGNLCRCTGYLPIIEAVETAARALGADPEDPR